MSTLSLLTHQQSPHVDLDHATFHDLLRARMEAAPDQEFLVFPENERRYTYREFYDLSIAASAWLDTKAQRGGAISILFRNTPEFLAIYFGAVALGITVVPINPDLMAPEIAFIVENSNGNIIFYDPELEGKLARVRAQIRTAVFFPLADVDELPNVDVPAMEAHLPTVHPTTAAAIIYTSGTTGFPKGVVLSHMNFLVDGKGIAEWFHLNSETRSLCILPLFHNNGLVVSTTASLHAGGTVILIDPKASLRSFWALVERYRATFTSVMPSILAAILALGSEGRPGRLKGIISGGQYLPPSLRQKFENKFAVPIFEGFGSTEAASYSCFQTYPAETRKPNSVGRVMPISEMKVVDENDVEVPDGTEGEICIRGANVAIGYHNLPELQEIRFRNGWYHSGDYGSRDEDGDYYFSSRKDDLIVKGGEKIYPAEIENVLSTHPNIIESAVIGIEDAILGQEICAFASLKDATASSESELLAYCAKSLARFKQPKRIVVINRLEDMPELPKGSTKKILYRELRAYYEGRLANGEDPEGLKWVLGSQGAG